MLCRGPEVFIKELFMHVRHDMPSKTQKKYHDRVEIKPLIASQPQPKKLLSICLKYGKLKSRKLNTKTESSSNEIKHQNKLLAFRFESITYIKATNF